MKAWPGSLLTDSKQIQAWTGQLEQKGLKSASVPTSSAFRHFVAKILAIDTAAGHHGPSPARPDPVSPVTTTVGTVTLSTATVGPNRFLSETPGSEHGNQVS